MENQTQVAVVTIPLSEWNEAKAMIKNLCDKVERLTDKDKKELLTPKEVCQELKIGRTTFDRYVNDGIFDPVKVNKKRYSKIYIRRTDLDNMIKEGKL